MDWRKLRKILIWSLVAVAAYASLIAFPLQYIPLPGYRAVGEPLTGGWRWGNSFGCFDDVPVLYFEGRDGFLVREGQIYTKLLENISAETKGGVFELKALLYPPGSPPGEKPVRVRIRYNDVGKILHLRDMHMDGAPVRDRTLLKSYILAQCGYPGLTLNLLKLFGIRKSWRPPGQGGGESSDVIEVR